MSPESIAQSIHIDIVHEIFSYFSTPLSIREGDGTRNFPWYLGHVCSSWRTAFLSMRQEFWARLLLCLPDGFVLKHDQRYVAVAKEFIKRNEGTPFSFKIHRCKPEFGCFRRPISWRDDSTDAETGDLLDIFLRESAHWQDVSLSLSLDGREIPRLMLLENSVPFLRSLALSIGRFTDPISYRQIKRIPAIVPNGYERIFHNSPCLTQIRLPNLSTWQFNWAALTVLELTRELPHDRLPQILPQMENLEELSVNQPGEQHYAYSEDVPGFITLPRLRFLHIAGFGLLLILTAHSLEELDICVAPDNRGWEVAPAICTTFFQRSSCRLDRLAIGTYTAEALAHILQLAPEITSLRFSVTNGFERLYRLLTCHRPPPQSILVPKVQSLRLALLILYDDEITALISMIESRMNQQLTRCLRELDILLFRVHQLRAKSRLDTLQLKCKKWGIRYRIVTQRAEAEWRGSLDRFFGDGCPGESCNTTYVLS